VTVQQWHYLKNKETIQSKNNITAVHHYLHFMAVYQVNLGYLDHPQFLPPFLLEEDLLG